MGVNERLPKELEELFARIPFLRQDSNAIKDAQNSLIPRLYLPRLVSFSSKSRRKIKQDQMFYAPDSGTERPSDNIGLLSKWYLNEFAAMYSSILLEYSPEINYKTIIWIALQWKHLENALYYEKKSL